jgi:hypothetical protein
MISCANTANGMSLTTFGGHLDAWHPIFAAVPSYVVGPSAHIGP